ncbi:DUF4129 domain-containing protein [Kitasatospora sp. NPDC058032]|uniref:DUF4129 domain-containing protein n=1 Tax=Kitasatospora sp. NPDC058032 TaxID=3346307 RepID=UPI0036DC0AA1
MAEHVPPDGSRRRAGGGAVGGRTVPLLLVAGGLLLAAAALRPADGLLGPPGDAVVRTTGPVVLIALGWAVLVGWFAARFRAEVRPLVGPTPWTERLREATGLLLGAAAALVPLLLLALHNRLRKPSGPQEPMVLPTRPAPTEPPEDSPPVEGGGNLLTLLLYALGALLVIALVVALTRVVLVRYRARQRARSLPAVGRVAPGEDALAAAVATGRRSLHGADARAAVIACYAAMEGSLAESGLERRIGDNPAELLERAVADDRVDRAPAYALTELFREARYSSHPMDDGHVRRARAALDTIAARLAADGGDRPAADGAGQSAADRAAAPRSRR